MIVESGYAFEICDDLGMPNRVVVLSSEERARLSRERGWHFYDF